MHFFGSIQKKYFIFLGIFVTGMFLFAIFGSRGLVQIFQLKEERKRIQTSNARLQEENRRLAGQIKGLRNNKEEVEKIARDLGFVKKGEIIYQFER